MLRPDTLVVMLSDKIPVNIMEFLRGFLNNRQFYAQSGMAKSNIVHIDRGCPQGSVLGLILFRPVCKQCGAEATRDQTGSVCR